MSDGEDIAFWWMEATSKEARHLSVLSDRIDTLVAQRVAEEREACAKIAEIPRGLMMDVTWPEQANRAGQKIAARIRRRGEESRVDIGGTESRGRVRE